MKRIMLIDGFNLLFRSYYAKQNIPNRKGISVGALSGVLLMITKLSNDYHCDDYIVCLDSQQSKTKRTEINSSYKANRKPPPKDLLDQIKIYKEFLNKCGINTCMKDGYEADDVIGSLANIYYNDFDEIIICSGDKDLFQLINDKVHQLWINKHGYSLLYIEDFYNIYGFDVDKFVDYKALLGDKSDNIPGCPGCGISGAMELIKKHGSIEELFQFIDIEHPVSKIYQLVNKYRELICQSYALSKIFTDLEINEIDNIKKPSEDELYDYLYNELEIHFTYVKYLESYIWNRNNLNTIPY